MAMGLGFCGGREVIVFIGGGREGLRVTFRDWDY